MPGNAVWSKVYSFCIHLTFELSCKLGWHLLTIHYRFPIRYVVIDYEVFNGISTSAYFDCVQQGVDGQIMRHWGLPPDTNERTIETSARFCSFGWQSDLHVLLTFTHGHIPDKCHHLQRPPPFLMNTGIFICIYFVYRMDLCVLVGHVRAPGVSINTKTFTVCNPSKRPNKKE